MADIYGRKIFVIIVCIVQGLCFLVLLLIQNPMVFYGTIFIFGTSIPLKNMMAYTHLMEFLPGRVTEYSGYLFFTEGMLLVISPLILIFVTVNTDIFLWVGLIQNAIGIALFMVMYVPESTIFLLEKERFE
jgi:MFS family permease